MAVHPPTGPFPPNDGSNIFRRAVPKPTAKSIPPAGPAEPADLIDLGDDEDALSGNVPPPVDDLGSALSGVMLDEPADDDQPVSAVLLDQLPEPSADEPISAELLDELPPPSAADSSIFTGGPVPTTAVEVGSGWLQDPPADPPSGDLWAEPVPTDLPMSDPPSTAKFADAADLFADLRADTPESAALWVETDTSAEATGRVSDSDVQRAFDATRPELKVEPADDPSDLFRTPHSMVEFDLGDDPVTAEIVTDASAGGGEFDSAEMYAGDPADSSAGGSSIFDHRPAADPPYHETDDISFDLPVSNDPSHQSSMSGVLPQVDDDPEAVAADLFGSDPSAGDSGILDAVEVDELPPADGTDDRAPAIAAAVAAGALGGVGSAPPRGKRQPAEPPKREKASAKVPPPPKRTRPAEDDDEDDRPTAKKGRSGIGGVLAGVVTGLVLGAGGFAGVYFAGLLPNDGKGGQAKVTVPTADPQLTAKVNQLTDDLKTAANKLEEERKATEAALDKADKAAADLKPTKDALTKAEANTATAVNDLKAAKAELTTAKLDAEAQRKDAADAKGMVETLKKDADTAKKEATDLKTELALADGKVKAAVDAGTKALEKATKEADLAKKDAEDKTKLALEAAKKLKAADDTLAAVAKELESAKLLDDPTKLTDSIKKLVTVATAGDAKKAAEAVLAAQKERDAAKTALAKAETEAKDAQAAATKAKTDADKLVAAAKKAADDQVKTAVDDATKGLKKQLDDATAAAKKAQDDLNTAKATAKADAEEAAKAKLDEAVEKATAAEKALATKVKELQADFANQLAAARAGAVKLTPVEMESTEKATRSYADGLAAYYAGRYADAEKQFAAATAGHPADARYWYYLGLARTQAKAEGADDAFRKGAEMEARNKPAVKLIDAAMERLSFADKQRVNKFRQ